VRQVIAFVVLALLSGCASTPEWVTAPNQCTVLFGGGGMVFPTESLNQNWFAINKKLSNDLADTLTVKGYRIDRLIVDIRDNESRLNALGKEVNSARCNRVVQVAHSLLATGKNTESFQFAISILGVSQGEDGLTFTGKYKKVYTFPLTKQTMQTLSMSTLAAQMAADIDASGRLNKTSAQKQ